jgi:hypothetical protein
MTKYLPDPTVVCGYRAVIVLRDDGKAARVQVTGRALPGDRQRIFTVASYVLHSTPPKRKSWAHLRTEEAA